MNKFLVSLLLAHISLGCLSQEFSSGPQKVPLIELYTSEGCSSCPPAERWFNKLAESKELWSHYVPIAFHVDYWDYIGWKDPYGSATHSRRQRQYKTEGNIKGVYTPGLIYMGTEWRSWYIDKRIPKVSWPDVGELTVKIKNQQANVIFRPIQDFNDTLKINVSILGFNLETKVKGGENKGKRLMHHFVNLANQTGLSNGKNQLYHWKIRLPSVSKFDNKRLAYVVWVSKNDQQRPIQSTGAWKL
ncbi:MAG: DUF1223 domain-containing protein [Kangiellaceae bacterium]|nr:DUF1223 domain-containing protein [Kangiellaceae bacterium]